MGPVVACVNCPGPEDDPCKPHVMMMMMMMMLMMLMVLMVFVFVSRD